MRMMLNAAFGLAPHYAGWAEVVTCMDTPVTALEFLEWLQEAINSRQIRVNQRGSIVHRCADGVLIASPAVFKAYVRAKGDGIEWEQVQRQVQRQRQWRVGAGIRTFVFEGGRKHGLLHGLVLSTEVLSVEHQVNPLIRETRSSIRKSRRVPS